MKMVMMAVLFAMIATTLMGMGVTAVLSMPGYTSQQLMLAAAAGFVIAIPVAWFVAGRVLANVKM